MDLLDFHRMAVTITKVAFTFQKLRPRVKNYRDCEGFDNKIYKNDMLKEIYKFCLEFSNSGFSGSVSTWFSKAIVCARQLYACRIIKNLSKIIRKKKEKGTRHGETTVCHFTNKQEYFDCQNEKLVSQNKTFGKFVSPLLSDRIVFNEQITLAENNELILKNGNGNFRKQNILEICKAFSFGKNSF